MNRWTQYAYLTFVYLFLYAPLGLLIVYSFNTATYSLLWHGFTFAWYKTLLADSNLANVALHSLEVGLLTATFATGIGIITATCFYRYRFFARKFLHSLMFILIVMPDLVLGIAFLILFTVLKIEPGFCTLLLAHTMLCAPFVTVTIFSRLSSFDQQLFEAARDLGANELIILWRIILPLVLPAILAGWLLSFTLSLDDVMISFFVTGPDFQTLPLYIYSLVRLGINPELNALCSVVFALTLCAVISAHIFLTRKKI